MHEEEGYERLLEKTDFNNDLIVFKCVAEDADENEEMKEGGHCVVLSDKT